MSVFDFKTAVSQYFSFLKEDFSFTDKKQGVYKNKASRLLTSGRDATGILQEGE